MESFGFDTINLGHGSGGTMTRDLLDQIIFKTFSNPFIDQKHDGSIVKFEGEIAISTDSFVVSPVFFKGGNIGELAVNGTVNDVAMCGAIPKYLSLAFIIEEGLPIEDFIKIVNSIKETADKSGVQIITGDTKVVERGKGDKIFINTTGFGEVNSNGKIAVEKKDAMRRRGVKSPNLAEALVMANSNNTPVSDRKPEPPPLPRTEDYQQAVDGVM